MAESVICHLEGVGGVRVSYRFWQSPEPSASVLCVHGLGEHSGRYQGLADTLAPLGLDLYAIDMRGHGLTQGKRGHVSHFELLLQDLDRLRRKADGRAASRGFFLVGHSLGGLVVGRYAEAFAPDGLRGIAFVAPFVDVALEVPAWKQSLGAAADRIAPGMTMDNGLDVETLFRLESDRSAYRDDPLVHRRISARLWGEMQRAAAGLVEEAARLRVPVLLQLAGEDMVVSNAASREFAARLPAEIEVREYDEAFHALFHDPRSPGILGDLGDWMTRRLEERHKGSRTPGSAGGPIDPAGADPEDSTVEDT
jgi:alpha-beta hydrolase superfamily lysophospholipase